MTKEQLYNALVQLCQERGITTEVTYDHLHDAVDSIVLDGAYRREPTTALTQVEFERDDFPKAEAIARRLGYEQYAYTSTSALWGLFCLPENPARARRGQRTEGGCIIKTRELGFLFVQNGEDLHLDDVWEASIRRGLEQSARGDVVDLGDFTQYANEEDD